MRFRDVRPGPQGPPDPAEVLELWYRAPLSLDLVKDGRDIAAPKRRPFRHHFGHVRFRVRLPDRTDVLVEFNPDDDVTKAVTKVEKERRGSIPGTLTAQRWETGYPGGGDDRNRRAPLVLSAPQVDVLLDTLDAWFPEGPDSEVEDHARYHLMSSNCVTTLADLYLGVLDRGGPLLPRQKRMRWAFATANSPATLWPRVRSTLRRWSEP